VRHLGSSRDMSAFPPRFRGHITAAAATASILCAALTVHAQEAPQDEDADSLGLRRGSYVILPSLEIGAGYTDNVARAPGPSQSGSVTEIAPSLSIYSDWTRHALNIDVSGVQTAYDGDFDTFNGSFDADVEGRLDIRSRTSLALRAGYGLEVGSGIKDHATSLEAELSHRFNRVSLSLRGGLDRFDYGEDRAGFLEAVDTAVSDYTEYRGALRMSYEVSPLTSAFVEGGINRRDHGPAIDDAGFARGSDGYETAVGVSLSNGSKLSGEVSVGYQVQRPDDPGLSRVAGWTLDGTLSWQATALTKVAIETETEFGETTLAGSAGYVDRSIGLNVEHALGRHILLYGDLTYTRSDFAGTTLIEETTEASIGMEYLLNRNLVLTADATHLRFDSTTAGQNYRANTVTLGMRIQH